MATTVKMTFEVQVADGDDEDVVGDAAMELEELLRSLGTGGPEEVQYQAGVRGIRACVEVDRGDFSSRDDERKESPPYEALERVLRESGLR